MEVALDLTSFQQSQSGTVTGLIWIRHETVDFPERGWSDFPVRILSWWLESLGSLARGEKVAVFSFMDGPFEFRVASHLSGTCQVQFIERISSPSICREFGIDLPTLQKSLQFAAAAVLTECSRRRWTGPDVDHLRSCAASLRH